MQTRLVAPKRSDGGRAKMDWEVHFFYHPGHAVGIRARILPSAGTDTFVFSHNVPSRQIISKKEFTDFAKWFPHLER